MSFTHFFYEPFYSLSDFDRLFEDAFKARAPETPTQRQLTQGPQSGVFRPRLDVHENKEQNMVTATFELPGLKKEDVTIDVHNDQLTVSGESKVEEKREEGDWVVRERRSGKFSRTMPLPQGIKDEEIKANMEQGVLKVTFPRTTPEAAHKKITIA
ncbi:hypothetical protein EW146_g3941 [Bondarzewia mesenterica]|uniref:SHSP domain-containing protein n=1 Tax=Bondarzewia mesenterica TaxID=1095465 RepID=A0A4S4LY66_9AGAM|nr:hypothetical protein EW146_g3941 [Bondarzewia mesenterica]